MTRIQSVAVVLNPNSGSASEPDDLQTQIRERLPNAKVFVSRDQGDVEVLSAKAQSMGFDAVIAAGGDGTLNEVLNGCMRSGGDITLGLLPLGTGNDFARSIDMPTAVPDALEVIGHAKLKPLDVVRVTGSGTRYMINVAAGGFAGVVSEKLTSEVKAAWGPLSYLRGMIDALSELQAYKASLRIDGGTAQELSLFNIVVANGSHVARGIPIAPDSKPGDGMMDVVAIREVPLASLALLAPQILAAAHLDNKEVLNFRARHLSIKSTPPMPFNADGEIIEGDGFEFTVLPNAVSFIVPPNKDSA